MQRLASDPQLDSPIRIGAEDREALIGYLAQEIEDGFASRNSIEALWREHLRMYVAEPVNSGRHIPYEGASELEVPLAATAADSIAAQMRGSMFAASPIITVTAVNGSRWVNHAKAIQRFVDWGTNGPFGAREAVSHCLKDVTKLGTCVYYTKWARQMRRNRLGELVWQGPRISSIPIEDFLVPGGAYGDLEEMAWVSLRFWYTQMEIEERAERLGWNLEHVEPAGTVDWVRARRETIARNRGDVSRKGDLYEIHQIYCTFPLGDTLSDLLVTFDRTSHSILNIQYSPYQNRPFNAAHYEINEHQFYGLGVIELLRGLHDGVSKTVNTWMDNAFLANTRMFTGPMGAVDHETMLIWPGRYVGSAQPDQIRELRLSDTYPSLPQLYQVFLGLAERRTGINDLTQPNQSQVLGSRTPAGTAQSLLQQAQTRFTPSFDSNRLAIAGAVKQCLYRCQERFLEGGAAAADMEFILEQVLGPEDGALASEILRREDFNENIGIEMTASSANVNRQVEQQQSIALMSQVWGPYARNVADMTMLLANPQTPPAVAGVLQKIISAGGELMDRTLRTFDHIKDPRSFIIDLEGGELEQVAAQERQLAAEQQLLAAAGIPTANGSNGSNQGRQTLDGIFGE